MLMHYEEYLRHPPWVVVRIAQGDESLRYYFTIVYRDVDAQLRCIVGPPRASRNKARCDALWWWVGRMRAEPGAGSVWSFDVEEILSRF
jgi:hypothetical protein